MWRYLQMCGLAAMVAFPCAVEAAEWHLQPETSSALVLTYGAGDPVSYKFECTANEVLVTETGVTKLMDLKTGNPIGDDAQAVMPAGSAMMALFGGKGDPDVYPESGAYLWRQPR